MDQLRRPSFGGTLSQLETLVGGALAARARFPSAGLADAALMARDERAARIEDVLAALFSLRPELEGISVYARRLLELPFERGDTRAVTAAWLSGRDVDPEAARAAALPGPLSDVDVLRALTVVAALAAGAAPLLIAFDQLENLADASGDRVRAHGNLVAELVDQLPALTLVQLALTGEWLQHIQPALSLPQRTRVAEQTLILEEPSADDRRALVRAWLETLGGDSRDLAAAPITEADIERWCREPGMTPRLLLQACRRALLAPVTSAPRTEPTPASRADEPSAGSLAGARSAGVTLDEPEAEAPRAAERTKPKVETLDRVLTRAWRAAVRDARREMRAARSDGRLVDPERIAEVLEVTLAADARVTLVWRRTAGASPYLVGTVVAEGVRGSVVIVQGHHPRSVATALERARELAPEPVLFVREGSFEFPPSWREVAARLSELQGMTRTCWLGISDDVLAHGLAFASMLAASRSGELVGPGGEVVSSAVLRAWSSAAIGGSVEVLDGELRRVLKEWRAPDAAPGDSPVSTAARPAVRPGIGAIVDVVVARWPWSKGPIRWLRMARDQARTARRSRGVD